MADIQLDEITSMIHLLTINISALEAAGLPDTTIDAKQLLRQLEQERSRITSARTEMVMTMKLFYEQLTHLSCTLKQ